MMPSSIACRRMLAVPRALVSQNKRRFQEDGFDLDLGYVHPRIIVMGYPAVGVEFLFRNPRSEVQQFLDKRHAGDYFVYNFCDEPNRCYPASIFDGRVKHFPIEDHNIPTFQLMYVQRRMTFCEEAASWLDANEKHVVALHCKAGKGRAGMMACMLLLRMGFAASATEAIDRYNRERVNDRRGLTVVSQKKWVNYYADLSIQTSALEQSIVESAVTIQKLKLNNTLTAAKPPKLRLRMYSLLPDGSQKKLVHQEIGFNEFELQDEIRGCVMLEFYRERVNGCMRCKHFKIWFNTYFLKPDKNTGSVVFSRSEMDWVARDKKYRRLPAAFELEMIVAGTDDL
ncbi:Phosphatidylinositol-3,4,5-trisphosphate 3-phosphatase [Phytophthora megakarya]|uniref:Phosphatidylinositol-3,4,5-trisphosphate 3-phosphatase n=1 Tax=Phytophthora megakarya TaxID=4795 RepID=A0A225X3A4_9STRA|nr:Phosphatidylinositol-3,4,5-trisphosphate 3-phosphatase [Phytophthora megakarya]